MAPPAVTLNFGPAAQAAIQGFGAVLGTKWQTDQDTIDAWQQYGKDLQGIQSDLNNRIIDTFTAKQRNNAAHATLDAAIAASTGLQRVAYQNAINAALKALWAVAGAALSGALKVPFA